MRTLVAVALVAAASTLSACRCGGPTYAGPRVANGAFASPCSTPLDCSSSVCCREAECPGGFCTELCVDDRSCPAYTICVDLGPYLACMISCASDYDCPDGYRCRDHGGRLICRQP